MQSYRFSNQSNINIIYNISLITITNTMSIINILANFGKYAISDCPFICLFVRLFIRSWITLEPFEISSLKLVQRCILVAAPSLFLFKVKGQGHEVNAKVRLEIAVTRLIFEIQQNLKNHNVVLLKAHLHNIINFRYHFRF